jgi:hypothetical protein
MAKFDPKELTGKQHALVLVLVLLQVALLVWLY